MKLKKKTLFVALFLFTEILYAYEDSFRIEDDFPAGTIIAQIANLSILIGILYFSQRKNIQQMFKEKKETFLNNVKEASASKKRAEDKLKEVSDRLNKLKSTFEKQVSESKASAEDSYRDQLAAAKNEALRLKNSSQSNLEFEIQKQVESLRLEAFQKSADLAEKSLIKNLTLEQLKTWNNHFTVNKQRAH